MCIHIVSISKDTYMYIYTYIYIYIMPAVCEMVDVMDPLAAPVDLEVWGGGVRGGGGGGSHPALPGARFRV